MPELSFSSNDKQVTLFIDGHPYHVTAFLTLMDFKTFFDAKEEDARQVVSKFVFKKIVADDSEKPSINQIMMQEDSCFLPLINALLEHSESLSSSYQALSSDEDICHRFLGAVKRNYNNELSKIKDIFNTFDFSSYFSDLKVKLSESVKIIIEALDAVSAPVNDLLNSISIPTLSEESKLKIIAAQKQWGNYGWTLPPSSPMYLFNTAPSSLEDANKTVLSYCKKHDINELFDILREFKQVRKSDLEEAIFDFENKKYKSCALILFGLIDARLIRLQPDKDRTKDGRRPTGRRAGKNLFDSIETEQDIDKTVYYLFSFYNLRACLLKVFEDGNDFKEQPQVINRNFLDHGMLHRKVCRRDCIQLFLLYYNLLEFLEAIFFVPKGKEE